MDDLNFEAKVVQVRTTSLWVVVLGPNPLILELVIDSFFKWGLSISPGSKMTNQSFGNMVSFPRVHYDQLLILYGSFHQHESPLRMLRRTGTFHVIIGMGMIIFRFFQDTSHEYHYPGTAPDAEYRQIWCSSISIPYSLWPETAPILPSSLEYYPASFYQGLWYVEYWFLCFGALCDLRGANVDWIVWLMDFLRPDQGSF